MKRSQLTLVLRYRDILGQINLICFRDSWPFVKLNLKLKQFYYISNMSYLNGIGGSFAKLVGKAITFYFVSIGQVLVEIMALEVINSG